MTARSSWSRRPWTAISTHGRRTTRARRRLAERGVVQQRVTPEIILGTNEEYEEDLNAGTVGNATIQPLGQSGLLSPGNGRLYALEAGGDSDGDPLLDDSTLRPGWPFKLGIVITGLLPVVGEGVTGNPVIGPVDCPQGDTGPNVGAVANNGPAYILNPDASSCYGESGDKPNALTSETTGNPQQVDRPVLPAVGHPAFGAQPEGLAFFTPAAGITRALDLALPEYQPTGQDFLAGWNTSTGQFKPGFPATVNDLQFLTGPSIADIGGGAGEEILAGTASKDLAAFSPTGTPADSGWPKATTDWTVANPLIGSFGTRDTDEDATKVVVNATRSGYLHVFETEGDACSPSSWPRFHHDNANSGEFDRDAALPGKPFGEDVEGQELTFRAPGDDLLCGTAASYEIRTSNAPIDESNFADATQLSGAPAPAEAGTEQTYTLGAEAQRYVAVRAVDEQGNVGRVASVDRGPNPEPPTACVNPIRGTAGADQLAGTADGDRIRGLGGRDRVAGRAGDDCLSGGAGKDRLRGGADDDLVRGGRGSDRLSGGSGDDTIRSRGQARDLVRCGRGEDTAKVDRRDRTRACESVIRKA
jgi:Ca2+-binding RTX toxin-like protein